MLDNESQGFLQVLEDHEKIRANRVPGVRTVLVVLSSRGMVFDRDAIRQKILLSYREAVVFFKNTRGDDLGGKSATEVDLLIDFTGPGQKQGLFYSRKLRKMARVAVGRDAGLFRKKIYDRIVDDKALLAALPPRDLLQGERCIQQKVLEAAGIALAQMGDTPLDRGKEIALELPPLSKL